jgi:hypothetical protein
VSILLILAACRTDDTPPTLTTRPLATLTPDIAIFATPDPEVNDGVRIGRLVATNGIDDNQCATEAVTVFPEDSEAVYIVAEDADIPRDTALMVRLFQNGAPVEDTIPLVAEEDYEDVCVFFVMEITGKGFFRSGEYTAQLFADDILRARINFVVR